MKPLALILAFCSIIATAEAKGGRSVKLTEKQKEELKAKEEKKKKDEEARKAVERVLAVKDKNGDGSLSKDEYLIGEADRAAAESRFNQYNKNGSRELEKSEIAASLGF